MQHNGKKIYILIKVFISIVEKDPTNYLTFFRRATVYLALGKSKSALPDLDKSIALRPGFVAVSMRVIVYFNFLFASMLLKNYSHI